ncbi:expressed unknown protein [Seminavis robusta]|uniref:Uncharacterized protein n=1 Tax=Seminavis robusta TaxID=568900 RepID=A0A9N8DHC5_9STRA|nr:expressed unknown protein [Seminavis robusta]|eukprot:Sro143_g066630.1 n/a (313) ;mRNA; r:55787-56725
MMTVRRSTTSSTTFAWIVSICMVGVSHAQYMNCTPCDIPLSEEAGAKVIGAMNCSDWEYDAMLDSKDSEICHLNRVAGVAFCGCEVPDHVTETCDLCPNGSVDVNLDRELPDVPGVTCADILNVPKVDGDQSCSLLQAKYAFWCDCPKVVPTCTLCPTGAFPPKPDKGLPFDRNLYCGDIATEFLVSTPKQCQELKSDIPVDLASYCECPGTTPPETCSLCPDGYFVNEYVVVENDLTCADIHQIARFSTNETVCEIMEDVHGKCCSVDEGWTAADGNDTPAESSSSNVVRWSSVLQIMILGSSLMLSLRVL